jgi:hypothetical protein
MAQDFVAAPTKASEAVVQGARSFEEMVEGLRRLTGVEKTHYDPFTGNHWEATAEEQPATQQQVAASAAQALLCLTARTPSDREFRRIYRGNLEYEIWGSSQQELDEKEQRIRQMYE